MMTIYPDITIGSYIYIPYFIIGIMAIYILINQKNLSYVPTYFLLFTGWTIFINMMLSVVDNYSIFYTIKTSIGCLFPVCAYILGKYYSKKIDLVIISKIFFFLLLLQAVVVYLQMKGTSLGVKTYLIYAGEKGAQYLQYINYGARYQALGTIGNPNELGVFCIILMGVLMFNDHVKKGAFIASFLLTGYIVLCSQSRTAMIVFCIIVFIRLQINSNKSTLKTIVKAILVPIAIIFIFSYLANKLGRAISVNEMTPRFILWNNAWTSVYAFSDEVNFLIMLFGRGISYIKSTGSTDNSYLQTLLSSGLIGLGFFLSTIILFHSRARKLSNCSNKLLCYSLLVILIVTCFVIDIYSSMKLSFFIFFMIGYLLNYTYVFTDNRRNYRII